MKNWDSLRYFLAVAKAKTVKEAALSMGVSHTTVLRHIDLFEQELEAKLFKRLQSGYELTTFGHSMLARANQVGEKIFQLEREIKGQDLKLSGQLRISQPENEVINLYPIYAKFNRLYPEIKLQIVSSINQSDLKRHEADVVLRLSEQPHDLLVGKCIGQVDFGIYGSKEYLKNKMISQNLSEMDWVLFSLFTQKSPKPIVQDHWLKSRVPQPNVVLQSTSSSGVINAIQAGMGVGFISTLEAKKYQNLTALPLDEVPFSLKLWVLTHQDLRQSAMVKAFMQHLTDNLGPKLS